MSEVPLYPDSGLRRGPRPDSDQESLRISVGTTERISIELMASDRKLKASREGSK